MLDPAAAWLKIESEIELLAPETVCRRESVGRVLAADLLATLDVPHADVSAMDGFAVDATVAAGEEIAVEGLSAAGDLPGQSYLAGRAHRIMTGAPVPEGADRIVPVELAERLADDTEGVATRVRFTEMTEAGRHIRRRGEVVETGRPILQAGALLTTGTAGLLATHGIDAVPVVGRPTVAFLTTGNEVVPPDQVPGPGQLRDSHSDFFQAATAQLGTTARALGIAPDDRTQLRQMVEAGLESDVLMMSGGVSKGDFDFVEEVLEANGCRILFDAIAIQPGKPMVAARHAGGWVFALPGNPASAMVTFWLLVRPALRCMMGHRDRYWREAMVGELAGPLPGAKGRDRFLPARVEPRNGQLVVHPQPPLGSHDVAAYARGTALVRIPAGSPPGVEGDSCEVLPLIEWPPELPARLG